MKKCVFVSSLLFVLVGCQTVKTTDNTKTFYIDSTLADCVGVAPMKCMKIKQNQQADWNCSMALSKDLTTNRVINIP